MQYWTSINQDNDRDNDNVTEVAHVNIARTNNCRIPYRLEQSPISNSSLSQITAYFGDKKFQLSGVFIDSAAAPWHTDSKYI